MPPKRKRKSEEDAAAVKKPKMAPKGPPKGQKMPPPLPDGEVLTGFSGHQWKIGGSVGKGGFGEIYIASPYGKNPASKTTHYVTKVEPHENGPLFTELSFYRRVAKPEYIEGWRKSHGLNYLPIPKYIDSGTHDRSHVKYRFMVMERFGDDIEKIFCSANRKFGMKTVCYLGLRIIEGLEYLHDNEYVHADIKGSNLLTGYQPVDKHKVHLVDYGLAYRYIVEGRHHGYTPDPRRSHDGTIEFTSIDAHDGANPSRRGDMEILGYCLIQWAGGELPWMGCLQNKQKVAAEKRKYKSNAPALLKACFKGEKVPTCLEKYMQNVYSYEYDETPDYCLLKTLFKDEMKDKKWQDNKDGLEWIISGSKKKSDMQLSGGPSPKKRKTSSEEVESSLNDSGSRKSARIAAISPRKRTAAVVDYESEESPELPSKKPQKLKKTVPSKSPTKSPKKGRSKPTSAKLKKAKPLSRKPPSKSPQKVSVNNGNGDIVSPSRKIPEACYPAKLGYKDSKGVMGVAETFGSLAKKKKSRV